MKLVHLRTLTAALAAGATLFGVTACGSADAGSPEKKDGVTTLRYMGSGVHLAEIADALGYLEDADIRIERVGEASGGPESLQTLATGEIDLATSYNGSIVKLVSTGVPITSVITYSGATDEVGSSLLVKEGSKAQKPEDLVGKKVAVNTLGANSEAILDTWLRRGGLSDDQIDQVTLVPLPGVAAEGSLRKGQVEAAIFSRADRENALANGGLRSLVSDHDLFGDYNIGTVALADAFIEKDPDTVRRLVKALADANEWLDTHTVEEGRDLLRPYMTERGRTEEASALEFWVGNGVTTDHGVIEPKDFELPLEWLEAEGEVDPGFDVSKVWTNEFNPYAQEGR